MARRREVTFKHRLSVGFLRARQHCPVSVSQLEAMFSVTCFQNLISVT